MLMGKVSLISNLVVLFQYFKTKNYKTNSSRWFLDPAI